MALEWLNVADWDDFVAAEADLKELFSAGKPPAADFRCFHVDNGKDPHNAESYLRKKIVGERVAAALSAGGGI
jgi:hypothetical protein